MPKSVPTPNTLNPEPRARAGKKRRTPSADDRRRKLYRQKVRRRGPPKIPGAEVFSNLRIALSNVQQRAISGEFDGRPDLVMEAFMNLDDLSCQAYETYFEFHRETNEYALMRHHRVKCLWSHVWKKDLETIWKEHLETSGSKR
jgi:hypothetical protein